MKIDLYHLYRRFDHNKLAHPIALEALKLWAESLGWEASVAVCREAKIKPDGGAEVVGISVYTQTAAAAYRVSDRLRRRGKLVILGGPHFRSQRTWKEGAAHCDVLVHSICRQQWQHLLEAIARARIAAGGQKTVFLVDRQHRFRYPDDLHTAYRGKKWYQVPSVPTSLGCPYDCSFCSPCMPGHYFLRDIKTVCAEVSRIREKVIFICDASFGLNKKYTVALMRALAPLGKKFLVETTLARLRDTDILDAMAGGGVRRIMVGIETLGSPLKKHGAPDPEAGVKRVIDQAHQRGIQIQGNVICGLDCDGPDSFERIERFYRRSNLDSILVNLLTPYPTTRLYDQFHREGRIIDHNWDHYDYHHLVYLPRRMSPDQLIDGYLHLYRSFSNGNSLLVNTLKDYRKIGVNAESNALLIYNLYARFDAARKERELRRNQRQLAAGGVNRPRRTAGSPIDVIAPGGDAPPTCLS